MNKNTVKRLADNPHYAMNDKELEALAQMLREEAESEKSEEVKETPTVKKVNKNRVNKTKPSLTKTPVLKEESDDVDAR